MDQKEMLGFEETLAYLYSLLPIFQREGAAALKPNLDNTRELCWALGLPQWQFQSIHIGGTNGKGSVSAMFNSILMENGLKVGMYTSPHLLSFTERIRINGIPMPEDRVVQFVDEQRSLIERIKPSFFELTVAMAFQYFAEEEVDVAVVEVGLGGRLDSTNVLSPELSIITNISYDHQHLLGDTLDKIAFEKAGIIKKFTPVVIGESHFETKSVFLKKASQVGAPISFADERYTVNSVRSDWEGQSVESQKLGDEDVGKQAYQLDLLGNYQTQNLATVLHGLEILLADGWEISQEAIEKGLSNIRKNSGLRGRMEVLGQDPLILTDTGHNIAGVKEVLKELANISYQKFHIVWGMVGDKDSAEILSLLPKDANYYFCSPNIPRGKPVNDLLIEASTHGLLGKIHPSVAAAIIQAKKSANKDDLVFIGGSTFVVAEALAMY